MNGDNMSGDGFIILAVHTAAHAEALGKELADHDIDVRLEDMVLKGVAGNFPVKVMVKESDLLRALKVAESGMSDIPLKTALKFEGTKGTVLIPVDFSPDSITACKVGFDLARRLKLSPVILHAYATPYLFGSPGEDTLDGGISSIFPDETAEVEEGIDLLKESERMMRRFRSKIEELQKKGEIPSMEFATRLNEGIPEDVIKDYCRETPPVVTVMATRGKAKRDEALIGSVTAEVIDSCRVPVFTVPENCRLESIESIIRLVYFCNLDRQDIVSVDTLMKLFEYPEVEVTLIPVGDRAGGSVKDKVGMLRDYFNKTYPAARFTAEVFPSASFREDFENFVSQTDVQLLIVPNKKRNVFSRLFNPGMAHKLLFERDTPMLALPV